MTIAGIGIDVVDLEAFGRQLARPGTTMRDHFTIAEHSCRSPDRTEVDHLGGRWAAKEAFVKAWAAANFGRPPALGHVDLREIEVVNDATGRPRLVLHGAVAAAFDDGEPVGLHLSTSHDGDTAVAVVVLER